MPDHKPTDMVDRPLPDLSLPDADGVPRPLLSHPGRPLTLFFFTHLRTPG